MGVPIGKSVLGGRRRPVHLVWGAYGVCLEFPIASGGVFERMFDFGKNCLQKVYKKFTKNFQNGLTERENRPATPIMGRAAK